MTELDDARKRIANNEVEMARIFEEAKPELLKIEAQFVQTIPGRLLDISNEVKSVIEQKEGVQLNEFKYSIYGYDTTDSSNIRHVRTNTTTGSFDYWEEGTKVIDSTDNYELGDREITNIYYHYDYKKNTPSELSSNIAKNGRDWLNQKVRFDTLFISFSTYVDSGWIGITFKIKRNGYVEVLTGKHQHLGGFSFNESKGLDALVEGLVKFIDNRSYFQNDMSKKNSDSLKVVPEKHKTKKKTRFSDRPVDKSDQVDIDSVTEMQYRRMLEEDRNRVLAEIEYRESADPNYHRPSWIPQDEKSILRNGGQTRFPGERYLSDDSFDDAVNRNFKRPPSGD